MTADRAAERAGPAPGVPGQRRGDASFPSVFGAALRGVPTEVIAADGHVEPLPVDRWRRVGAGDRALLALCVGPTLDVGCGPGRLAAHLTARGRVVLGLDLVPEAVAQTRARGAPAVLRDVFSPVPGEGRWGTALLADGNIGIGGDPVALLRRVARLVVPAGRVVLDLEPPGTGWSTQWARLRSGDRTSRPFRWSRVALDAVHDLAASAGLEVERAERLVLGAAAGAAGGAGATAEPARWAAVLRTPAPAP